MKVVLINHSDVRGGASVVTLRLTEALRAAGVEATMLVGRKEGSSPYVVEGSPWRRRLSFATEHLDIVMRNSLSRKNLFKISTGRFGMELHRHPLVRQADIVVLAWVNQGTMSLDEIEKIGREKPIVWVMHDRWCQTGICHHPAEGCNRLASRCGMCPLLVKPSYTDLSRKVFEAKAKLYSRLHYPALSFVAVSRWLRDVGAEGLTGSALKVIPNAFPVESYPCRPTLSRSELGLPEGPLVVMGAARLDDPVKNLPLAIASLKLLKNKATAVFFGNIKDPSALDALSLPYRHLGPLADEKQVAAVMAHADVVLSSSRFETLPTTLIEGMSAGATPVTTGHGGQADIIAHGVDGYIAADDEPETLSALIDKALTAPFPREQQHAAAARRFAADIIARRYIELFEELIADFKS